MATVKENYKRKMKARKARQKRQRRREPQRARVPAQQDQRNLDFEETVPTDLHCHVLSFLSWRELAKLHTVNKRWNQLLCRPACYKHLDETFFSNVRFSLDDAIVVDPTVPLRVLTGANHVTFRRRCGPYWFSFLPRIVLIEALSMKITDMHRVVDNMIPRTDSTMWQNFNKLRHVGLETSRNFGLDYCVQTLGNSQVRKSLETLTLYVARNDWPYLQSNGRQIQNTIYIQTVDALESMSRLNTLNVSGSVYLCDDLMSAVDNNNIRPFQHKIEHITAMDLHLSYDEPSAINFGCLPLLVHTGLSSLRLRLFLCMLSDTEFASLFKRVDMAKLQMVEIPLWFRRLDVHQFSEQDVSNSLALVAQIPDEHILSFLPLRDILIKSYSARGSPFFSNVWDLLFICLSMLHSPCSSALQSINFEIKTRISSDDLDRPAFAPTLEKIRQTIRQMVRMSVRRNIEYSITVDVYGDRLAQSTFTDFFTTAIGPTRKYGGVQSLLFQRDHQQRPITDFFALKKHIC